MPGANGNAHAWMKYNNHVPASSAVDRNQEIQAGN